MVFVERIQNQVEQFINIPFTAKFGGATGNLNAHHVAFPKKDWAKIADEFVEDKTWFASANSSQLKLNITIILLRISII